MSKKKVFLIDDDETFVFLTGRIIKSTEKAESVKTFVNGREAIDFITQHSNNAEELPDIIFFDLNMPILDGWGFLEEFVSLQEKLKKSIKMYIITSSISVHDIERAKSYPIISDYLVKPVHKEKFADILANV
jgi:CheY-like chemotaxis protein